MKKRMSLLMMLTILSLLVIGCSKDNPQENVDDVVLQEAIQFIDDSGRTIVLEKPAEKLISLYSVHTENLYALGMGDVIIGVGTSDEYPAEVLEKTQYSYRDDAELIIAANPDVLIIRSMIEDRYPDYIKAIEDAGITVVNLYCSEYEEFDEYMSRLGMIVGKEETARELVNSFHEEIDRIVAQTSSISPKQRAYFESIGPKFKTATPVSFAGKALEILGVDNIAKDVEYDGSSSVITFGEEALLARSADIDVYIAQNGAMNKSVSLEEIKSRPGFSSIKAVQNDNVVIIDEKLISGATMRYLEGLKVLQDAIYGNE